MSKQNNRKTVLIIPDKRLDLDLMAASISLGQGFLSNRYNVKLLVNDINYPQFIQKIFPLNGLQRKGAEPTQEYVLTLDRDTTKVNKIDWEQTKGHVKIMISTSNGVQNPRNTQINRVEGSFDRVILLGSHKFRPSSIEHITTKDPIISIKYDQKINEQTSITFQNSLSEQVFKYLTKHNLKISKSIATDLLAGIYWKTTGLTENIKDTNVFITVRKLLKNGANLKIARSKAFQTLRGREIRLIGEIFSKFRIDKNNIGTAIITKDIINKLKLNEIIFRFWDILKYSLDAKFIIILLEKNINYGYVFSNERTVRAADLVNTYNGYGNDYKAIFESDNEINLIEKQLKINIKDSLKSKPTQTLNLATQRVVSKKNKDVKAGYTSPQHPLINSGEVIKPLIIDSSNGVSQKTQKASKMPLPTADKDN